MRDEQTARTGEKTRRFVDWHSHIWLPEHLGDEWGRELDAHYTDPPSSNGSPERHYQVLQESGVSRSVVIALASRHLNLDVPNEFVADYVATDPARLSGIASVDPHDPDAPKALRYAFSDLGLSGLKLAPPYQNIHPHAHEAYALYEITDQAAGVLIFHQGAVTHRRGVLEYAQPILLDRVARDFPSLKIVIAHMGQPWYPEVVALMRKHANVFADVSARCQRPWQLMQMLQAAMDYGVETKLLFGSDFPVFNPREHALALLSIDELTEGPRRIPRTVLEGILYDRPPELLGLPSAM